MPADGTGPTTVDPPTVAGARVAATPGAALADTLIKVAGRGPAPVHLWNPPYCGEMDLLIRADGLWIHNGSPIGREAMVRLFASVLKREGDGYFLVTPVEKLGIRVEDAPFLAIDADIGPAEVSFTTNLGDRVVAGPDHRLRVKVGDDGSPRPYVHVRGGLDALIDRKTFYRLIEAARQDPDGQLRLTSGGIDFDLGRASDDDGPGGGSGESGPGGSGPVGDASGGGASGGGASGGGASGGGGSGAGASGRGSGENGSPARASGAGCAIRHLSPATESAARPTGTRGHKANRRGGLAFASPPPSGRARPCLPHRMPG